MDEQELASAIVDEMERRGLPAGAWLVDIGLARQSIAFIDQLLRRIQEAILDEENAAGNLPESP